MTPKIRYFNSIVQNKQDDGKGTHRAAFEGGARDLLRQHRSKEWKKERIYKLLTAFDGSDFKD